MACELCEQLMFRFTEELGEFVNINLMYMSQLELEKDEDDISDEGLALVNARISQGAVLFNIIQEIVAATVQGHDEDGGNVQLDLFGTRPPKLSS